MTQHISAVLLILCTGPLAGAGQNAPLKSVPSEIKELAYEVSDVRYIETSGGVPGLTFAHGLEVGSDIFVIDAQNPKPRKLISGGAAPAWSPDGSELAYCTWKGAGLGQLEVANADGTGRRQITNMKGGACYPDWSPDGTKIVFTALSIGASEKNLTDATINHLAIFAVDKNGGDAVPIAPGFAARWSPGGTMLVILRGADKKGPAHSVWLATADGKQSKMLVASDSRMKGAAWLPDGKGIAVSYMRDGKYSIFRIYLDGSQSQGNQPKRIGGDARADWYEPSLSADGKHLIAIKDCGANHWEPYSNTDTVCRGSAIVLLDIDTNKDVTLASGFNYSVVWERK